MKEIDLSHAISTSKFDSFHMKILLWSVAILAIDGYDIAIGGVALPSIMTDMNVDAKQVGLMIGSGLAGMTVGAIGLGILADKIGRRWSLILCVALFSVFTTAAAFTTDPVTFGIVRFLAGLGIGGSAPSVAALMTEYGPNKNRSLMVALMSCGYAVGGIMAAVVGKQFIEQYGWQSVFLLGGLPILLIPFMLRSIPESPWFLYRRNRYAELRKILSHFVPDHGSKEGEPIILTNTERQAGAPVAKLFLDGRGMSTVMIWIAFFMGLFMLYALNVWLTKLLAMSGYSLGSALTFVLVYNCGGFIGSIGGGLLADRYNIKWVLAGLYAIATGSLLLLGLGPTPTALFVLVMLLGVSTVGAQGIGYAYAAQFYPSDMRATGVGFASGVPRAGAMRAPVIIAGLVSLNLSLAQNFTAIAVSGFIGFIAVLCIQHRLSSSRIQEPGSGGPLMQKGLA